MKRGSASNPLPPASDQKRVPGHAGKGKQKPQQKRERLLPCLSPDRYVVENGTRRVQPYFFRFEVFCKQRWLGRTLIDVVGAEWVAYGRPYFQIAIHWGLVLVNGQVVSHDYVLKQKDLISHFVHRHEPPVCSDEVEILHRGEDGLVVVDKPATVPVHPCGGYYHNSVVSLLGAYHPDLGGLKTIHRLDRLTSGVLLLATNGATVHRVSTMLRDGGGVEKVYYARVVGKFPRGPNCDSASDIHRRLCGDAGWLSVAWEGVSNVGRKSEGGEKSKLLKSTLRFSCPLRCVEPAKSRHGCHPEGKPAVTLFSLVGVSDSENCSIVRCVPKTGRTHQIRLHLQKLGFPIANDPNYGPLSSEATFYARKRADARQVAAAELNKMFEKMSKDVGTAVEACDAAVLQGDVGAAKPTLKTENHPKYHTSSSVLEQRAKRLCAACRTENVASESAKDHASRLFHGGLFLRAVEYKCPEWSFKCKEPTWAQVVDKST